MGCVELIQLFGGSQGIGLDIGSKKIKLARSRIPNKGFRWFGLRAWIHRRGWLSPATLLILSDWGKNWQTGE
jgi:hypothetical protein